MATEGRTEERVPEQTDKRFLRARPVAALRVSKSNEFRELSREQEELSCLLSGRVKLLKYSVDYWAIGWTTRDLKLINTKR